MTARAPAVLVAVLVSVAGVAAAAPPADWPASRADARNSAAVVIDLPAGETPRAWTFDGSGRTLGYEPGLTIWSPPAIASVAGRPLLVVGSYDRSVYALDAATGVRAWRYTTGGAVYAAPILVREPDGVVVYAASSDRTIYALDAATGRPRWVHSVEAYRPSLGGARLEAPAAGAVAGERAIFVAHWVWDRSLGGNLQRAGVTALHAADGKPLWSRDLGDNQLTAPLYVEVAGRPRLYVGSANGNLYALDAADGRVLWHHTELDAVRGPPALLDGPDPLIIGASKYGAVRALDPETGAERWSFKTGDRVTGSPALFGVGGRTLVAVGSYDRTLYALDAATGAPVWRYAARGGIYSSPAIAGADGEAPLVVVSAWDHNLHVVSGLDGAARLRRYTGRPLWDVSGLDESNWSSPIVARLGGRWMAFVGSYDGALRALPLDESAPSAVRSGANLGFWLSLPAALVPLVGLALFLTRRHRRKGPGPRRLHL